MPNIPDTSNEHGLSTYTDAIEAVAQQTPETETPPPPSTDTPERPRGPDGRYLKADETPATPPGKGFPPTLRRQAKQILGLSDDDLADMTAAEVRSELRFHQLSQRLDRSTETGRSAQTAPSEPSVPALSADDTTYEQLVATVNDLRARLAGIEDAAQQIPRMAQYLNAHAQQEQLSQADELDDFFAQHPETYGAGTWQDVDRDSPDFGFREAMAKAALKETRGRTKGLRAALERLHAQRTGRQAAPKSRPRAEATSAEEVAEDEVERLYANGSGVLNRPSQRGNVPMPRGMKRAEAEVSAILDKSKAASGYRNSIIPGTLDGLPE